MLRAGGYFPALFYDEFVSALAFEGIKGGLIVFVGFMFRCIGL